MTTIARRRSTQKNQTRLIERVPRWRAILAWIIGVLYVFPVVYIWATGFKTEAEAVALPPSIIPTPGGELPGTFAFTFENYEAVLARGFWPRILQSIRWLLDRGHAPSTPSELVGRRDAEIAP